MPSFSLDKTILTVTLGLAGYSLALVWSTNSDILPIQFLFFLIGFIALFIFAHIDIKYMRSIKLILYTLACGLLILTLLEAQVRGASRWLDIFGLRMQPSEILKPIFIFALADTLSANSDNPMRWVKIIATIFFPLLLIFLQPDLGNVIIYTLFFFAMLYADNLNLKVILTLFISAVLASPILWNFLHDYQKKRILTFLNPNADPQGTGYNAIQAIIAVGSGLLFGQGLGRGTQSHLRFLPENHTDFIFASLAEEMGFVGILVLMTLYLILLYKLLQYARESRDKFTYLLTIGITTQIFSQVVINIAMNLGILPITGVTLPLMSAGGSSIVATFICLGLIMGAKKERSQAPLVIR